MVILSLIKADVSGIDKFFRDRESYSLIPTGVKPSASVTGLLAAGLSQDGHVTKCDSSGKRSSFNIFRGQLPPFLSIFYPRMQAF